MVCLNEKGLRQIRKVRASEEKRYTIEAISSAIGVSPTTYWRFEKDPKKIPGGVAEKLADYLGCDVSDVFYLPNEAS